MYSPYVSKNRYYSDYFTTFLRQNWQNEETKYTPIIFQIDISVEPYGSPWIYFSRKGEGKPRICTLGHAGIDNNEDTRRVVLFRQLAARVNYFLPSPRNYPLSDITEKVFEFMKIVTYFIQIIAPVKHTLVLLHEKRYKVRQFDQKQWNMYVYTLISGIKLCAYMKLHVQTVSFTIMMIIFV